MKYYCTRAFTLIELMIGIAITAILITFAVPAMNGHSRDAAIRRVAEEARMGLQLAKAEAIRRNGTVVFVVNGPDWQVQAVPDDGGANIVVNARSSTGNEAQVNVNASGGSIGFTGTGRSSFGGNYQVTFSNPTQGACQDSGGSVRCLQINVATSGQIRMCDPALAGTDPRAC